MSQRKKIEIMDTTLRDGEQMRNVSYTAHEKLTLAKLLLEEVKIDRLEITSARVSEGEKNAAADIIEWAKKVNKVEKIEILGFVDITKSVDWLNSVGCKTMNLLTKGSMNHLTNQLKKTKEEHVGQIKDTINYAHNHGIAINIYFEDWSSGMRNSRDYVYYLLDNLKDSGVKRFMLPDTLGILYPSETSQMISEVVEKYPDLHFDFHGHNDYGLATANSLAALESGAGGVHLTVNGMGERAGNSPLDEVVAGINDFPSLKDTIETQVNEKAISLVSREVEIFSGLRVAYNKPILGENVYTQTAGLHADGDLKGDLYANPLIPERFGRTRTYALGKLAGMASLTNNLNKLNIELEEDQKKKVLQRIIELGDKKEIITEEDLPYIISDVLEKPSEETFKIKQCRIITSNNLKPLATVKVSYNNDEIEESQSGDGGYDAFMKAIREIGKKLNLEFPLLENYNVIIPPGGKTDALVQTTITWSNGKSFKTKGVDSDQLLSAVEATEKMVNIVINNLAKTS